MFWEDVYQMYELACNFNSLETNDEMKFQFILHADSKSKWQDLSLPYPDKDFIKTKAPKREEPFFVQRVTKREKASVQQLERAKYVKNRLAEHKKKLIEMGY
jgi:hypothetical protein